MPDDVSVTELIRTEVEGGIARVTIDRVDAGNSLTAEMRDHLADTFDVRLSCFQGHAIRMELWEPVQAELELALDRQSRAVGALLDLRDLAVGLDQSGEHDFEITTGR